jgi:hypothetical protein
MICRLVTVGVTGCLRCPTKHILPILDIKKRYILTSSCQAELSDICKQPNLCQSELRAVDHANKKFSDRYLASGAAAVICARHGLVRKNGMGSLQKGERSALFSAAALQLLIPR